MNVIELLKTKGKKPLVLGVSVLILLTLATGVVSAGTSPTSFDIKDSYNKYTVRITFPNGEGMGYEENFHIEDVDLGFVKIAFNKSWEYQDRVNVTIEVLGADKTDWRFYNRDEMWDAGSQTRHVIKNWDDTNNKFMLFWSTKPSETYGEFYFVQVTDNAPSGSGFLAFLLMPEEREEKVEDKYFIEPTVKEITFGDSITFSLIKQVNGKNSTVSNNEVDWVVTNEKSINPDISSADANIGTIDSSTGVFKSSNIGTCSVVARVNKETKAKAEVTVNCCKDCKGDINKVIKLYQSRIPEGQLWKDGDTPAAILNNPPAAGYYNNILSVGSDKYAPYVCQAYQDKVMKFLYNVRSNPDECSLLAGYEFSRITGWGGVHLAVVVYKEGTNWEETGLVFDPWLSQKPEVYSMDQWKFYGRTKDKSLIDETGDLVDGIVGLVWCPVDILITDDQGRQLGVLDDGSMATEIPNSFIVNFQDDEGNKHWYFELGTDNSNTYDLKITGNDDGTFGTVWADSYSNSIRHYAEQTITKGSTAGIVLDTGNPVAPLILPDGTEIKPTVSGVIPQLQGLTFESRSKPAGSSVQIPLTLSGIEENIGNMDMTLSYDPSVLEATDVIKGGLTTNSLFDYNIVDGTIKISLADKAGFSGDGSIAYVRFDVIGSEGLSSDLEIAAITANRADNYDAIEIQTHDGLFNVISLEEGIGDGDGDGVYTALDALYALQMSVEKIPQDPVMDTNGDGSVTSFDARSILKNAVE
ncbi:MAG: hypothetical protein JXA98_08395 [Methanosarcinaceae archaeon]|nr:hypothetical protein [Methanosarcinaceae archaeon]